MLGFAPKGARACVCVLGYKHLPPLERKRISPVSRICEVQSTKHKVPKPKDQNPKPFLRKYPPNTSRFGNAIYGQNIGAGSHVGVVSSRRFINRIERSLNG